MARPLNNIRDWQNIHGITPRMMNQSYKKAIMASSIFTYEINDRLFSEEDYVSLMQFRKNYIIKLHALLEERLPPRPTINIRIPKKYINYYVNSLNKSRRLLNEKVAAITNASSRKNATVKTVSFTDIEIIIKYGGSPYKFLFNIVNPENKEMWQMRNTRPEINGVNIQDTVFEAVKELSEEAASIIKEFSPRRYFRPPSNGNNGGPGYQRTLEGWTSKVRARKTRKTRKNRK
jgi:hypothetical protein